MREAPQVEEGIARVRLKYHYLNTGRSLWEAGHITGCRKMVRGVDPFRWPKEMREAALGGMGAEFDDKSCYPVAWRAMHGGRVGPMTEAYITHKEEVLAVYGEHLWPDQPEEDRRERMKGAFSALDNDGGINAWAKRFPSKKTLAGVQKRLKNGFIFNVSTYKKEQEESTGAAMQRSERAIQYLGRLWEGKTKGTSTERKKRTTLKSYLLQETEATSREAKLRWGWDGEQNQDHKPAARRSGSERARQHTHGRGGQRDGSSSLSRVQV